MNNTTIFVGSIFLQFSVFTLWLYYFHAQKIIEYIMSEGMKKNIDPLDENGVIYYSEKLDNWTTGAVFMSSTTKILGTLMMLFSGALNLYYNAWYLSIVSIILSYLIYVALFFTMKKKVQTACLIGIITSSVFIAIGLL